MSKLNLPLIDVELLKILYISGSIEMFISRSEQSFLVRSFNFFSTHSWKFSPTIVYITFAIYALCNDSISACSAGRALKTFGYFFANSSIPSTLNPVNWGTCICLMSLLLIIILFPLMMSRKWNTLITWYVSRYAPTSVAKNLKHSCFELNL